MRAPRNMSQQAQEQGQKKVRITYHKPTYQLAFHKVLFSRLLVIGTQVCQQSLGQINNEIKPLSPLSSGDHSQRLAIFMPATDNRS